MDAQQGDRLVIEGTQVGAARRAGTVMEVLGAAGSRRYRVRWDDGHETVFFPGPEAAVERPAGEVADAGDAAAPTSLQAQTAVEVHLDETDDHTDAKATIHTRAGTFTGIGRARRHPADPQVPLVGEELAVARALIDLARSLEAAAGELISSGESSDAHLVG